MKTYSAKPTDVTRKWYIVDASKRHLAASLPRSPPC